jgi:cytochrome c-type biogenesis protein CcmH/NrfG
LSQCARGDAAGCRASAERAIAHRPDDWRAHVALGHARLAEEAPEAAVRAYADAIARVPEAQSHWLLARLQKHLRPRLAARGGFSWSFLAAEDVDEIEALDVE